MVFELLVVVRLGRFTEHCGVLPTTQFAYRKGLGTCDALFRVSNTLQSALESGLVARIVQIDFSAAFDNVNHQGILYKLSSVSIGCSVLSVLRRFLSNRSQCGLIHSLSTNPTKGFRIKSSSIKIYVFDCHINHIYVYIN